jgi:hypothetical protein
MKIREFLPEWVVSAALALMMSLTSCQASSPPGTETEDTAIASCDWAASGESRENRFGYAVAAAGDVNGDGYDDVIVGADRYRSFTGRAYVYTGGPDGLDTSPIFAGTGEDVNNHFGYAVGAAGDVNGDGYGDVIVGAYHYSNFRGRVYVYAGGPDGLRNNPISVKAGESPDIYFGRSVGTAGDVNGDGFDDVVVGAQAFDRSTGRAYVYTGGPNGLGADPIFVSNGEGPSNSYGQSVGWAGDINGDGYDDVIIGAHAYRNGTGRAYVHVGGASGLSDDPIFVGTGEDEDHRFGYAVASAGDVNSDGYDDVIIGAYGFGNGTGRAYVYGGGLEGLSASPIFTATGESLSSWFGGSVGTAGDVNRDGYDDIIVGAQNHESNTGRVYVYLGGANGLEVTPRLVATGEAPNNWCGKSVGTAGDVNGDGFADLLVGAYGNNGWAGRAYACLGNPD